MFLDGGTQYTSAIFVDGPEQRRAAEASVAALDAKEIFPGPVKTKVIDLDVFWPAEKVPPGLLSAQRGAIRVLPVALGARRVRAGRVGWTSG